MEVVENLGALKEGHLMKYYNRGHNAWRYGVYPSKETISKRSRGGRLIEKTRVWSFWRDSPEEAISAFYSSSGSFSFLILGTSELILYGNILRNSKIEEDEEYKDLLI